MGNQPRFILIIIGNKWSTILQVLENKNIRKNKKINFAQALHLERIF